MLRYGPARYARAFTAAALTPQLLQSMDMREVMMLGTALHLGEDSLVLLRQQRVTGAHLLAMREGALLERLGMRPMDALALLQAVERARSGGPKTVRLAPSEAAPAAALWQTFEAQQELAEFLARMGAAGLRRGGSRVLSSRLTQVRARRERREAALPPGHSALALRPARASCSTA